MKISTLWERSEDLIQHLAEQWGLHAMPGVFPQAGVLGACLGRIHPDQDTAGCLVWLLFSSCCCSDILIMNCCRFGSLVVSSACGGLLVNPTACRGTYLHRQSVGPIIFQ